MVDKEVVYEILDNVKKYNGTLTFANNRELLKSLKQQDLKDIILSWLDSVGSSQSVDYEKVRFTAVLCSFSPELDNEVMIWAQSSQLKLKYEVMLKFITGYWAAGRNPTNKCIAFIVNIIENELLKGSDTYFYALTTLYVISDPVEIMTVSMQERKKLSNLLLSHLPYVEKSGVYPGVVEQLNKLKDFDSRKYFAVFDSGKNNISYSFEEDEIDDVVDALIKWLDIWEKSGCFDQNSMWYAGRLLGASGLAGFDQHVCKWLLHSPTIERYAIMGAFVDGYWRVMENIDKLSYITFKGAINELPVNSEAYALISSALSTVDGKIS